MKILVTGADGLLGSNLVRELLGRGYTVRAFVKRGRQQKTLAGLPLEKFWGDLLNPEEVTNATEGCDAVIHCGADTRVWPARSETVKNINIEGTKNIVRAVYQHRVQRLLYVGTANSFGFGSKENPGTEEIPYQCARYGLDYMDSKYQAQQFILNEVRENGLPAVVLNPTFMLGPYDSNPSSGAMLIALYHQKVPGYTAGGKNYIYVKDVAVAIANALSKGRIGECYILGNQNLSYREAFEKMAAILGVAPPAFPIPPLFAILWGLINTFAGTVSRRTPVVSYLLTQIACDEHYFSPAKAIRELELPQTPIEKGIDECFCWLRDNGYLKKKN